MARLFALLCIIPSVSFAQSMCGDRTKVTENLVNKFGESHIGGGLQSATQMIELWSSHETGTFTVLLTRPNGISCIMSTGKNWVTFPAVMPTGQPT